MSEIFLNIVNMSISAGWLVLAVLLVRFILKKAPKWISVLLWGFVAFRLICPFTFESILSLIPSAQTIHPNIMMDATPEIHSGIASFNSMINPIVTETFAPNMGDSMNPLQLWIPLAAIGWIVGIATMLIYTAVSYFLLRRKVATAVLLKENIFQSENVDSPFVLGIIRPKIFLPFQMDEQALEYVIVHEQAHIRRKDHWWKPFGFVLLAIHWFNPLVWIGYILLCRDIELACDEKVIKELDSNGKADYTQALVTCSVNRRSIAACPLAFGEVGIKQRVKSVMNYKKPTFWIIILSVVICLTIVTCFLTNPISNTLGTIENCNLDAVTQKNTAAFVSDGNAQWYIGAVERSMLEQLYDLRISRKEISLDRSYERDRSNTLILNLPSHEIGQIMTSYIGGTFIHFNEDFTEVWVDDHTNATLSYKVLKPEKAKSLYGAFKALTKNHDANREVAETFTSDFATYYKNVDGTWQMNGLVYQYRLEITGRMPRASVETTFVYLSNLESISFERAYMAAGLSSNISSYFAPEEAVLVEWITHDIGSADPEADTDFVLKTDKLDASISEAVLNYHKDAKPDGLLNTESHMIMVKEVASGTPLSGQTGHIREETVYVYYLVQRFSIQSHQPETVRSIYGQAIMTFTVDENGIYSLKHFVKPESSADPGVEYGAELIDQFVAASEKIAENEESYNKQLLDGCIKNANEYKEHLINQSTAQPGR